MSKQAKRYNIKVSSKTYSRLRRIREGMRTASARDFTMEQVIVAMADHIEERSCTL